MTGNVYTVSQINSYIHAMFEADGRLRSVSVKGELSNVKYHWSGHIYFTLKDASGALKAVMFKSAAQTLKTKLSDGMEVVIGGSISTHERDGCYQLYANTVEVGGEGALFEKYERLRKELEEMGMFDPAYKREIPAYVRTLGVVTAPTGAAVRDIIDVSKRRFPYIRIVLYPAKVQGEGAAESICHGIRLLDEYGVDCMIVGRGGGSIEDLWAFNEESVARAIFECNTPVISAVGHETDTTIADWVADMRAPTPSAGAEIAVFDYSSFLGQCEYEKDRLGRAMGASLLRAKNSLIRLEGRLGKKSPASGIKEKNMRLISDTERLERAMKDLLAKARQREESLSSRIDGAMDLSLRTAKHSIALYAARLEGLSPLKKLSQGYSVATEKSGRVIKSVEQVKAGDDISVNLKDGAVLARVTEVTPK